MTINHVTGVLCAALLAALWTAGSPAYADDVDDCSAGNAQEIISGCTHLIETGQIDGIPITSRNLAFAYSNRGQAYHENGHYNRALRDLTEAIRLDPDYHVAHTARGNAYARSGEYELAIGDHSEAIRLAPQNGTAYFNRGLVHFLYESFADAVLDFKRAVVLEPNDATMRQSFGDTLYFTGDVARALAEWRAACTFATANQTQRWKARLQTLGHYEGEMDGACGPDMVQAFEACAREGCYF